VLVFVLNAVWRCGFGGVVCGVGVGVGFCMDCFL
jgi:hypothetical protein